MKQNVHALYEKSLFQKARSKQQASSKQEKRILGPAFPIHTQKNVFDKTKLRAKFGR